MNNGAPARSERAAAKMTAMPSHRRLALALGCCAALLAPAGARADEEDLGRRTSSDKPRTWVVRLEGGNEYAPWGHIGACVSYLNLDALAEIEVGGGTGLPGFQGGIALRKLLGDEGNYVVLELSVAGNAVKELGRDPLIGHFNASHFWSALGGGFEHRAGFLSISVIAAAAFTGAADGVPHLMVHGGAGLSF